MLKTCMGKLHYEDVEYTDVEYTILETGRKSYRAIDRLIKRLKSRYLGDKYLEQKLDSIRSEAETILTSAEKLYLEIFPLTILGLPKKIRKKFEDAAIYTVLGVVDRSSWNSYVKVEFNEEEVKVIEKKLRKYGLKFLEHPLDSPFIERAKYSHKK